MPFVVAVTASQEALLKQVLFHTTTLERAAAICEEGFDRDAYFCTGKPTSQQNGGTQVLMYAGTTAQVGHYRRQAPDSHYLIPKEATKDLECLASVPFQDWTDAKRRLMEERRDLNWAMF